MQRTEVRMNQIIGYARVSTLDQNVAAQVVRLKRAGAIKIFEDKISGARFDRPGLKAAMDYSRQGDTICVVRLDRLGRSVRELLDVVAKLKQRGIGLSSLEEKIDTSSASGELIFHIFCSIAAFERRLIAERTRDGLAAAKAKGVKFGRPNVEAERIEAAMLLVRGGISPTRAARQIGIGRSTIYRRLSQASHEVFPYARNV